MVVALDKLQRRNFLLQGKACPQYMGHNFSQKQPRGRLVAVVAFIAHVEGLRNNPFYIYAAGQG